MELSGIEKQEIINILLAVLRTPDFANGKENPLYNRINNLINKLNG